MTSDDFTILQQAFENALALTGDARDAFVAEFEQAHPQLAGQLQRLLLADGSPDGTLADPIAASVKTLAEQTEDPWIGRQVGAWAITRRIGAGGMGAVFLAERADDQYAQTAAVKIMSAQLLDAGAKARFLAERQILANLNHPNIAKLIDGGSTEDNLPYLVMEYIEGERVDAYCDAGALPIETCLKLFRTICATVDFAHRNLVVHRDLKPSNILITKDGAPKLLDFGIAKILEPGAYDMTMARTAEGARAMTPEYASPEQVRGEPVSVATDIYSLGVLLFRLLTGQSPYGPAATTAREIENAILDAEPKRPSTVVSGSTQTGLAEKTGSQRPLSVDQLRRSLAGDLDNIVLKCLQKDPDRRYVTARDLAEDIDRYLTGRPVAARGDVWTYKAQKFARRHAAPLTAGAAVTLGAIALTAFYTHRLTVERDRAELAATQATEVSGFLSTIFKSASPFVAQGETVTAIDLLEQAAARIETLAGQPELQAKLSRIVGESYIGLGEFEKAQTLFQRAVELSGGAEPGDVETLIAAYNGLAESKRNLGAYYDALANRRRALGLSQRFYGDSHPATAGVRARIGATLSSAGDCGEAIPILQDAANVLKDEHGEYANIRLNALGVLAVCYDTAGRYDEAEAIGREIVRDSEETLGALEPNTIIRISNLALVLRRQWKLEEAAALFETAVDRADRTLPDGHADRAYYRFVLANALQKLGRFSEVEALNRAITEQTLQTSGAESLDYAVRLYGWGGYYRDTGDLPAAIEAFSSAASLSDALQGETSYVSVISRINLAASLADGGDLASAEATLNAIEPSLETVGADHQANAHMARAQIYSARGEFAEATEMFDRIAADAEARVSADSPAMLPLLTAMAAHFRRAGDVGRAVSLGERAAAIGDAALPEGNWIAALAKVEYAKALAENGAADEPLATAAAACRDLVATFGPDSARITALGVCI